MMVPLPCCSGKGKSEQGISPYPVKNAGHNQIIERTQSICLNLNIINRLFKFGFLIFFILKFKLIYLF